MALQVPGIVSFRSAFECDYQQVPVYLSVHQLEAVFVGDMGISALQDPFVLQDALDASGVLLSGRVVLVQIMEPVDRFAFIVDVGGDGHPLEGQQLLLDSVGDLRGRILIDLPTLPGEGQYAVPLVGVHGMGERQQTLILAVYRLTPIQIVAQRGSRVLGDPGFGEDEQPVAVLGDAHRRHLSLQRCRLDAGDLGFGIRSGGRVAYGIRCRRGLAGGGVCCPDAGVRGCGLGFGPHAAIMLLGGQKLAFEFPDTFLTGAEKIIDLAGVVAAFDDPDPGVYTMQ